MKRRKLIVALEEVTEISAEPLSRPLTEPLFDVDSAAEQMEETAREISDLHASVEEVSDDIQSLGILKDTMEDSIERDEGLSEPAAEIAEIAVEAICNRLGIAMDKVAMPAVESFSKVSTRKLATEAVMDSIKNALKAVFDAIVKVIRHVGELIVKFKKFLSLNTEKLENNISVLKNAIGNVKTDPTSETVESREAVNAFLLPGNNTKITIENVKTIANDTGALLKLGSVIMTQTEEAYKEISDTNENIKKSGGSSSISNILNTLITNLETVIEDSSNAIHKGCDDLSDYKESQSAHNEIRGQLANAQSVVIEKKKVQSGVKQPVIELNIVKQDTQVSKGLQAETLSKVDLLQTIRLADHLLSVLKDYQDNKNFNEDKTKEHEEVINNLTQALIEADSSPDAVSIVRNLKLNMDGFSALTELSKVTIPKLAMNTINEMCRYMKASLDAY